MLEVILLWLALGFITILIMRLLKGKHSLQDYAVMVAIGPFGFIGIFIMAIADLWQWMGEKEL